MQRITVSFTSLKACHDRRGAMLMLIVLCLPVMLIFGAFAINVAWMQLTRTELRTATDAAVRAGGRALSISQDVPTARSRAIDAAFRNTVAGSKLVIQNSEVQFGKSVLNASGGYDFTVTADNDANISGIRVTGGRTSAAGSQPVQMLFTGMFDRTSFEPVKTAVASQIDRDVVLVLDRSGSMNSRTSGGTRWSDLKLAVEGFLTALSATPQSEKVGLVTYATSATLNQNMNLDYVTLQSTINGISPNGATAIGEGMEIAITAVKNSAYARPLAAKTIVVMTDGIHNTGIYPDVVATTAAGQNITVHTITFSRGADKTLMQTTAKNGKGKHWHADDQASLINVFKEVARNLPTLITE